MAGSMKDIKLRIKSVESTMQITKAMELVASSKMRRAKERVEHSRPYFETLYKTLTEIAAAEPRARNPYLRRDEVKRTLLIVIAGAGVGRGDLGQSLMQRFKVGAAVLHPFLGAAHFGGSHQFHCLGDLHGALYAFNAQLDVLHGTSHALRLLP